MAQLQATWAEVMVNGQTVLSVVNGMGAFARKATEILARHGIEAPEPEKWYPQKAWVGAFAEISKTIGARTVNNIGRNIPTSASFPPGIDSVEKALATCEQAYQMNHRGARSGDYKYTKTGDKRGTMECRDPYPCDFDWGILEAMVRRFMPAGSAPRVSHDTTKPCRSKGGDSCTYLISW